MTSLKPDICPCCGTDISDITGAVAMHAEQMARIDQRDRLRDQHAEALGRMWNAGWNAALIASNDAIRALRRAPAPEPPKP
jgi:hypothetical protein